MYSVLWLNEISGGHSYSLLAGLFEVGIREVNKRTELAVSDVRRFREKTTAPVKGDHFKNGLQARF
jgi:hypothetical protein